MNHHTLHAAFLLAALVPPALAQEPVRPAPTVARGPVLVVKTAQPGLAGMLAAAFDKTDALPDLPEGGHYVLSLGTDRQLTVQKGTGAVGFLEASADPGGLMDLFAEPIESAKPMIRGAMTLALSQQGMPAKDVAVAMDDVFAFPRQLQKLSLKVTGDPQHAKEHGMDVVLTVEPKAGATFAGVVEALQPGPGAPVLPGQDHPLLDLQISVAPAGLQKLLQPIMAMASRVGTRDAEQQRRTASVYERFLGLYDGGVSASFGANMQGQILIGLTDPEAAQKLVASDDYLTMVKNQTTANRDLKVEVVPAAFEHRGAKVLKSQITNEGEPNPMMPNGSLETYFAVVGNCYVGTMGGKEAQAKALIDAVADQKVKRVPVPGGEVLHVAIDVKRFAAMLAPMTGATPSDDMPSQLTIDLGAHDQALRLRAHVQ